MTIEGRTFTFVYSGNTIIEIREGGSAKLRVVWNEERTEVKALEFEKKRLDLELGDKPRVESVAGLAVVGGLDKSLSKIRSNASPTKTYEFGVNKAMQPTLKIGGHLLTWDPATQLVVSDGKWNYDIKPGETPASNAQMSRNDGKGAYEYWFEDTVKRVDTDVSADGIKTVTTRFPRGILSDNRRKQEQFQGGKLIDAKSWSYDDQGRLLREIHNGKGSTYVYDKKERLSEIVDDEGKKLMSFSYDDKDRLEKKTTSDGKVVWERKYGKDGSLQREVNDDVVFEYERHPDGSYRRFQKDPQSGNVVRRWLFDSSGRNTEFTTTRGEFFKIHYDELGRKQKIFRNGYLSELYVFEGAGQDVVKEITFKGNGKSIDYVRSIATDAQGVKTSTINLVSQISPSELQTLTSLFKN